MGILGSGDYVMHAFFFEFQKFLYILYIIHTQIINDTTNDDDDEEEKGEKKKIIDAIINCNKIA